MKKIYVMHAGKRCFISRNQDAKNAESRYDMRNRNTAEIAKNNHFTTYKEKACGFIRGLFPGQYISLNIIIDEFTGNFMQGSFIGCMGNGFKTRGSKS